jgi:hypothetical protein
MKIGYVRVSKQEQHEETMLFVFIANRISPRKSHWSPNLCQTCIYSVDKPGEASLNLFLPHTPLPQPIRHLLIQRVSCLCQNNTYLGSVVGFVGDEVAEEG